MVANVIRGLNFSVNECILRTNFGMSHFTEKETTAHCSKVARIYIFSLIFNFGQKTDLDSGGSMDDKDPKINLKFGREIIIFVFPE